MKGNQLTQEDPWSTAPVQPEPAQAPIEPPAQSAPAGTAQVEVKPVVVSGGEGKITLTFKGAGGYGDRWIVAHVANPAEGLELLNDPKFKELLDLSKRIATYDGAGSAPAQGGGGGGGQSQSRAPQAAQEAPGGEKQFCQHGEMVYKSGIAKSSGKPYALFSCTAPRGEQCDAKWPAKK